jgi:hypothetical protein
MDLLEFLSGIQTVPESQKWVCEQDNSAQSENIGKTDSKPNEHLQYDFVQTYLPNRVLDYYFKKLYIRNLHGEIKQTSGKNETSHFPFFVASQFIGSQVLLRGNQGGHLENTEHIYIYARRISPIISIILRSLDRSACVVNIETIGVRPIQEIGAPTRELINICSIRQQRGLNQQIRTWITNESNKRVEVGLAMSSERFMSDNIKPLRQIGGLLLFQPESSDKFISVIETLKNLMSPICSVIVYDKVETIAKILTEVLKSNNFRSIVFKDLVYDNESSSTERNAILALQKAYFPPRLRRHMDINSN